MQIPGIEPPKGPSTYVPPPPKDGLSIPPPPANPDVKTFPISTGPSPDSMSFPGILTEAVANGKGDGTGAPADLLSPSTKRVSLKKPKVVEPSKEVVHPSVKMKPLFWRRHINNPDEATETVWSHIEDCKVNQKEIEGRFQEKK